MPLRGIEIHETFVFRETRESATRCAVCTAVLWLIDSFDVCSSTVYVLNNT